MIYVIVIYVVVMVRFFKWYEIVLIKVRIGEKFSDVRNGVKVFFVVYVFVV